MSILVDFLVFIESGQTCTGKCLENQHGVMCRQRTSRLGDNIRLLQIILFASIYQRRHGIIHVLLNRVVHAVSARGRACSIVVYTQAPANIHEMYIVS